MQSIASLRANPTEIRWSNQVKISLNEKIILFHFMLLNNNEIETNSLDILHVTQKNLCQLKKFKKKPFFPLFPFFIYGIVKRKREGTLFLSCASAPYDQGGNIP